jgi:outer membrane protein OmpA-like peptidoglycan-associated protein
MADLDVQPKKKTSILPWLIAGVVLLLLLFLLSKGCNDAANTAATSSTDTTVRGATRVTTSDTTATDNWYNVNLDAPAVSYEELGDKDVETRGNDNYGIYSLGENILFDEGKSSLRSSAADKLKNIVASIDKRYPGGEIRIYGYTDATGDANTNKQLAQNRAEAVRDWLTSNGKVNKDRISLNAIGEAKPVASNATGQGRQQNRRVEIVAHR